MTQHNGESLQADVTFGSVKTMSSKAEGALVHLTKADGVRIADGQPDIRGWEVRGPRGGTVGEIADLLIDTSAMQVRYVEVKLDEDAAKAAARARGATDPRIEASRYALVPIGLARMDEAHDRVYLAAGAGPLFDLPEYDPDDPDELTREYERQLLRCYELPAKTDAGNAFIATLERVESGEPFYAEPHFDESAFLGQRRRAGDQTRYIAVDPTVARHRAKS